MRLGKVNWVITKIEHITQRHGIVALGPVVPSLALTDRGQTASPHAACGKPDVSCFSSSEALNAWCSAHSPCS